MMLRQVYYHGLTYPGTYATPLQAKDIGAGEWMDLLLPSSTIPVADLISANSVYVPN